MEYLLLIVAIIILILWIGKNNPNTTVERKLAIQREVERDKDREKICPHCQTKGSVTTREVKRKSGIHGGKATAAVLTAGISLLGTGLSRKHQGTEAHCSNCGATWYF